MGKRGGTMKRWVVVALCCCFFAGCGGYGEGVEQPAERSYLKFSGDLHNVMVKIDDLAPFSLSERGVGQNIVHRISPGKHRIKISRADEVIVERILILENQVTREVQIP